MTLKFQDIDEWTPSSISIVDVPAHPLCTFEVYDDDDEFVKKSLQNLQKKNLEGEKMDQKNNTENQMTFSERLIESLVNILVAKSEEKPEKPVVPEKPVQKPKIDDSMEDLVARIEKLEAAVEALKKEDKEDKNEDKEAKVDDAVQKNEGNTSDASGASDSDTVDQRDVVVKSQSLDPDTISSSDESGKSLMERVGRNYNGMTW